MNYEIKSRYIPDSQDRNGVATVEESTVKIEGKGFAGTELVAEDRKREKEREIYGYPCIYSNCLPFQNQSGLLSVDKE